MDDTTLIRSTIRFRRDGVLVEPGANLRVVRNDPDVDIVVATAIAGEADFIVSGDRHLLELGEYKGIRIIPPATFLAMLQYDL